MLPEAEDVDVQIDDSDLQIDVYRSSGPGGQSVNTTDSAVRITHKPSGVVVSMQDEKSQLQNREKAMRVLRARLYERALAEQQAELSADRRSQVGTGERAEKIRTYNFPQGRVTDHRIKLTVHNLDAVLEGELDEFTAALAGRREAAPARGPGRGLIPACRRRSLIGASPTARRCGCRWRSRPPTCARRAATTPRLDAELLLADALDATRTSLHLHPERDARRPPSARASPTLVRATARARAGRLHAAARTASVTST